MEFILYIAAIVAAFVAGLLMKSPFQAKAKAEADATIEKLEREGKDLLNEIEAMAKRAVTKPKAKTRKKK